MSTVEIGKFEDLTKASVAWNDKSEKTHTFLQVPSLRIGKKTKFSKLSASTILGRFALSGVKPSTPKCGRNKHRDAPFGGQGVWWQQQGACLVWRPDGEPSGDTCKKCINSFKQVSIQIQREKPATGKESYISTPEATISWFNLAQPLINTHEKWSTMTSQIFAPIATQYFDGP